MIRWLIFNSVTAFIVVYLLYYLNAFSWLLTNDPTHLSLVIASVYVLVSSYLGYGTFKGRLDAGFLNWVPTMLLGLGLIGTVIGFKIVFGAVNFSDIKTAIIELVEGMSIATTTTAMALSAGWLLDLQTWFVTGRTGDAR